MENATSEAKVAPVQCCVSFQHVAQWVGGENATSGLGNVSMIESKVASAQYCGCRDVARFGYVGKYRL